MKAFYTHFAGGASSAEALAAARRSFIHSDRKLYRHPYYWAPFVLIGRSVTLD